MNQNDLDNDIHTSGKIDYGHNYLTRGTGAHAANEVGRTRSSSGENTTFYQTDISDTPSLEVTIRF
jgi:hypothetical protein